MNKNWRTAFAVYLQPSVIAIVFLGFASGLPYVLVFSTLSAWLTEAGIERSIIGFVSWVGITYSIKVFWSMIVDRLPIPLVTRWLGKRRSWMFVAQIGAALGLLGMGLSNPHEQLQQIILLAIWVSFCSATQDVAIDAYRIEVLSAEYQGAMAAAYVAGYRISLLTGAAGCLYLAEYTSWNVAYSSMAAAMLIGIITILCIKEPPIKNDEQAVQTEHELDVFLGVAQPTTLWQRGVAGFSNIVLSPFVEYFNRKGKLGLLILLLIGMYKMSDIMLGVMANPFYLDMGFSKTDIAQVTKVFSFVMAITGAAVGGVLVARFGLMRPLFYGAILTAMTNLLYACFAMNTPTLAGLALIVSTDSFCAGMATSAFIAYLSSLTSTAYTATQYALFSSLMTLPAQLLGGFSGVVVENFGYPLFFIYTTIAGLPAIILIMILMRYHPKHVNRAE
jgi:PAT family beta-lactamase induction signal transducer AmpG